MSLSLLERALLDKGVPAVEKLIRDNNLALEWHSIARPEQLAPGTPGSISSRAGWRHWLALAGRRWGKTLSGAHWIQEQVEQSRRRTIALIAPTLNDAWKIMVDGPTGLLRVAKPEWRPKPVYSKRLLFWPNGVLGEIHTSEEPDRLRGRAIDAYWGEELGFWKYPDKTWDNLNLAMMSTGPKGDPPQGFIATTPKTIKLLKRLLARALAQDPAVVMTGGSTYENAGNLDALALAEILQQYEGTRLGRQELHAQLLEDAEGALWRMALIDETRVEKVDRAELVRIVIAIDPAVTSNPNSDETGIVVVGLGSNGHGYVLEDLSGRYPAHEWAAVAISAYERWGAAHIVAERNQGGDLVERNLRADERGRLLPIRLVHAKVGKWARAEPVEHLYELRKVHHVGRHPELEEQQTQWEPMVKREDSTAGPAAKESPNRIDALTYGITELMLGQLPASYGEIEWKSPKRMF